MSTPLLVVLPYHAADISLAKKLLEWIAELSTHDVSFHSCLLLSDAAVSEEDQAAVGKLAKRSFNYVPRMPVRVNGGHAPNVMFLAAARWIADCCRVPWLWLEPDCVPLRCSWLDELAQDYEQSAMKFVGAFVRQTSDPTLPEVHLTGCSMYPPDAWSVYGKMSQLTSANVAWDIEAAGMVLPRARETKLIQHYYGTKELPPTFVEKRVSNAPANQLGPDFLKPDAVLYHRCKDGSLIDVLRKKVK